jgi:hypothetical protein
MCTLFQGRFTCPEHALLISTLLVIPFSFLVPHHGNRLACMRHVGFYPTGRDIPAEPNQAKHRRVYISLKFTLTPTRHET